MVRWCKELIESVHSRVIKYAQKMFLLFRHREFVERWLDILNGYVKEVCGESVGRVEGLES